MKQIYSLLALTGSVLSDAPVFCQYASSLGTWKYAIGTPGDSQEIVSKCDLTNLGTVTKYVTYKLEERNKVTNVDTGSTGTYTIVSGQGFELSIDGRKFWAYYYFDEETGNTDCERTVVGYQRDENMRTWNCIQGARIRGPEVSNLEKSSEDFVDNFFDPNFDAEAYWTEKREFLDTQYYVENKQNIEKINQKAKTWTAKHYKDFEQYTLAEMQARQGWQPVSLQKLGDQYNDIEEKLQAARDFKFPEGAPLNFDWRDQNGVNYDSPVWDQMGCGSCFAFASKSYIESSIRINTNNANKPTISVQEMITCGADENYNQGCSGGFAYLTAGKEAYERGFVDESCDLDNLRYQYNSTVCPDTSGCNRYYSTGYEYLGGYYGAATPEMMVEHLYKRGPLSVGIAVPNDFRSYSTGIYHSTSLTESPQNTDPWNPLQPTAHAVVVVGYGKCPDVISENDENCDAGNEGLPYWIVKNSWNAGWGDKGYIRVLLGVDEIYIESKPFVGTYASHY